MKNFMLKNIVCLCLALCGVSVQAAAKYWDTNDITAGAGGATFTIGFKDHQSAGFGFAVPSSGQIAPCSIQERICCQTGSSTSRRRPTAAAPALSIFSSSSATGILFSLFVAGLAAFNLALNFDVIERGAKAQLPAHMEWYAALGLLVTIVWLYLEILRLLSKLRER